MHNYEIASSSFIIVQSEWTVRKTQKIIEQLDPSHIIVFLFDGTDHYFLLGKTEAINLLYKVEETDTVQKAFDLNVNSSTPVVDAYSEAEDAPDRCVIVEEGVIIGFFDIFMQLEDERQRGFGRRTSKTDELITRSIISDFPKELTLGETASLLVELSVENLSKPEVLIALPGGSQIDIVVQPKCGLVLEGKGEGSFTITENEEALPLQFKLKAIDQGKARIIIFVFHQGQALGALQLVTSVLASGENANSERQSSEQKLSGILVNQPDLSLFIVEQMWNGQPAFSFRITAAESSFNLNLKKFGPVQLRVDPFNYFQELFKDIEGLPISTPIEKLKLEKRLNAIGANLFETVFPSDLRALLWSLKDRIKFVSIQSEEPWIPWELCKLQGNKDARIVEGPFFCEAFAVTRWLPGIGFKPKLSLKKLGLVVPDDSRLPMAASEKEYLLSLGNLNRQVDCISADYLSVLNSLNSGAYDCWHFTGHGSFREDNPNRSAILLKNQDRLTPLEISGTAKNLGLGDPIIFLNACQVGKSSFSLTDIGGWASQFLRAGAAAFIGTYWSVYDKPAYHFTKEIYEGLLSGLPIGEAARNARSAIKPLGDPTWLAYTVYAHPNASIDHPDL